MLQLNNLCVRHFQRTFIPSRAANPACLPTESSGWMMVLEHVTYPFEAVGLLPCFISAVQTVIAP